MMPSRPVHTLPLIRAITDIRALTEITVTSPQRPAQPVEPVEDCPGTTPSGTYPVSSRAVNRIPRITASTDLRPCSLQ